MVPSDLGLLKRQISTKFKFLGFFAHVYLQITIMPKGPPGAK